MASAVANTLGMAVPTTIGPVTAVAVVDATGTQITPESARTTGGSTPYSFLSTAAVQAASIKASIGQVYGLHFFNVGAAAVYGRLYNMATSPANTDTASIVYRFLVPGNTAGAGFVVPMPAGAAEAFSLGIGIRVSGAIADNDATSLSANQVLGNVFFK